MGWKSSEEILVRKIHSENGWFVSMRDKYKIFIVYISEEERGTH